MAGVTHVLLIAFATTLVLWNMADSQRPSPCGCESVEHSPVCGVNNITYLNVCELNCERVDQWYVGVCRAASPIPEWARAMANAGARGYLKGWDRNKKRGGQMAKGRMRN